MPTDPVRACPECGAALPLGATPGQCPNCLLGLGLAVAQAEGQTSEGGDQSAEASTPHPASVPRPSSLATVLGDYELLEEIGRGGMGIVYKARQKSLDRIVALKLLMFGPQAPAESVKRFRAEAVATAALQHPNIVAIHEVGVHQGEHFLVMDFVEGRNLAKIISDFGFRVSDFKRALGYVKTIAEAVHYAHERGLLHRDLKPSNVLIDEQDQPRVTDFGLARRLEGDSELTVSGQVLGSPNYMPPEQASGKRGKASRRSDVYALGAILYHALTGRPPFVGQGLADTVQQVLNVEPVAPRTLNPQLPVDLETICLKCLAKEPAKRYPTAQALADELGRFLNGKPVLARPIGPVGKVGRWCRRNPRLALATGAAVLSLVVGLGGVSWQWQRADSQRARAEVEALLARRNSYAADMKEVQRALDESDLGRALELLNQHRPQGKSEVRSSKSEVDLRSWEWRYLWARCESDERFSLCQYPKAVSALAFSPDGNWLAVRLRGGTVALWDTVANKLVSEWPVRGPDQALAFSPRGTLLAWGTKNTNGAPSVSLRDIVTGEEFAALLHPTDVVSIAFTPDALKLATLDLVGTVHLWNLGSRKVERFFTDSQLAAAVDSLAELSGDAGRTSVASAEASAGLWEPESPPAVFAFSPQWGRWRLRDRQGKVLFSPDGRLMAVGDPIPRIRLWDWVAGEEKSPVSLPAPAAGITAMAFSPDGRLLAAGCGFGGANLHVWDVLAGRGVRLTGHRGWVMGLVFSPDGKTLASASSDQTLRLWNVERKLEVRRLQGNTDEVSAIAWSPDGGILVTGTKDGTVRFWNPGAKPASPYVILPAKTWSWGLAFSPDGKTLLTVARPEGVVVSWKAATLERVETLAELGSNHISLDLSRDGRWLALGDTNGNIQVWDFPAHQQVTNLVFPDALPFAVTFSPRGRYLHVGAVAANRSLVGKMWDTATWHEVSQDGVEVRRPCDLSFSADDRLVAVGHDDGTADWWDIRTLKRLRVFDDHHVDMMCVQFSPDGRHFAMAGLNDGRMRLWDVATGQDRLIGRGYRNGLHDLAFTADGRRLVTSGTTPNDVVKIWDVETGRDIAMLPGEPGLFYRRIGFSPDGNTLFVNSLEGVTLLWRAPSWDEIEEAEAKRKTP